MGIRTKMIEHDGPDGFVTWLYVFLLVLVFCIFAALLVAK